MKDLLKIPNIVTSTRIIFALAMFLVEPLRWSFYVLYLLCGLSDIIDGLLARKLNQSTKFGQVFDSIADFVWIAATLIILINHFEVNNHIFYCLLVICIIRFATLAVGAIKFRQFCSIHTLLNKLTGFMLFLLPFLAEVADFSLICWVIIALAFIASVEEFFIVIRCKHLNRDTKSIFSAIK